MRLRHVVLLGGPGVGKGTFSGIIARETGWKHLSVGEMLREEVRSGSELGGRVSNILKKGGLVSDEIANEIAFSSLSAMRNLHDLKNIEIDVDVEKENQVKADSERRKKKFGVGVLLDGYPRTVGQAEALCEFINLHKDDKDDSRLSGLSAVQINLEPWVALQKLLHRSECTTCKRGFNSAHIVERGFDMPAILPDPETCPKGPKDCDPRMESRNDDSEATIRARMREYEEKTAPVAAYFDNKGCLDVFPVTKGIKDSPQLLQIIQRRLDLA